ncbi:hypothetical protein [Acetobacter fallax]|uniref:DUF4154 domain-containing protein n=1 Tax=Acetobacter fallax TaxID=1737473 RepID=A0ABX0K4S9_9PROT|nr:hypothetical protein [Acetobacter fallax]NHO31339.1 hypothetical protein [Acetobacter fallax]NHO34896.1 hypothetical protein [Acetobacter fallax]
MMGCVGCALCAAAPDAGSSSFNTKDIAILGQTLHFVDPPPDSIVRIAVVYNSAVPGSKDEATGIMKQFPEDLSVSGFSLHPFIVNLDQIGQAAFNAAISTTGAGTPQLRQALNAHHAICITNHLDQVSEGYCQIYMTSQPSVDIRLNQAASDAADVHFATAFRIMVRTL